MVVSRKSSRSRWCRVSVTAVLRGATREWRGEWCWCQGRWRHGVTLALHPDARTREWEQLVGGSPGGDAQPHASSSSSVPHAPVVPPLCRRHCRPRDTCPAEALLSSGGDVTVAVRPRPCVVGEWEGKERERASSSSHRRHPALSSSSDPTVLVLVWWGRCHCRLSAFAYCRRMGGERARERRRRLVIVTPRSCRRHLTPHPRPCLVGASPSPSIRVCAL